MAANPPREGLEFVPGTMDEVGVELLKHVDDPQDVIAYAGYGFWAPASAIGKVKGAKSEDLTNAPIAPTTGPYIDDSAYAGREVDEYGQPVAADDHEVEADLKANAPVEEPDVPADEDANGGDEKKPAAKSRKRAADAE